MGSAYRRIDRMFNRAFRSVGLAHAQGQVLACLLQYGEMRPRDVAAKTGFDHSVVSRLVQELGRRKLVRRRRDPDDGRSMLLRPSRRAEALREPIRHVLERVNGRLRRDLALADLEGFERVTDVMARLP
jgi:DNA-binding MarR family transcriptional regulator